MCGLLGMFVFAQSSRTVDPGVLDLMRDELSHRGPDGAGSWLSNDRKVGLAHRRLSIIDLSTAAAQPMSNEDDTLWITFNGEIYNHAEIRAELEKLGGHKWKTDHSDTEVILHAFEQWGIDCLDRLRGMFAFALWDTKKRELWLVRDRIGIKPLYYAVQSGRIAFASEIKALLKIPEQERAIDETSLFNYLSFLTVPAPRTLFKNIQKLTAGCWLRVRDDGSVKEHRYWDMLDHADPMSGSSDGEIAERLLAELRTAVRLMRVSDVPVGAFLSGGIDSSANVALLSEGGTSRVKTFTAGFGGQTTYRNETDYARRIANLYHAEYHEKILGVEDLIEFLPKMVYLQDEPIADPVCVPLYFLAKLARENGVVVCQVGEGADELFYGYPSWRMLRRLQTVGDLPVPHLLKEGVLRGLGLMGQQASRSYEFLRRNQAGLPVFWTGAEGFTGEEKEQLLSPRMRSKFRGLTGWDALAPYYARYQDKTRGRETGLSWMTYSDLSLRLPELLLARVDKMSMGEGVEGRVPFLDHGVVELALRIPESVKTRHGTLKYILKRAVRGVVPDDVIDRPKQGFGVPITEWIVDRLGDHAKASIREMVAETDLFDAREVERMLKVGRGSRIWLLLNLALWRKRFLV